MHPGLLLHIDRLLLLLACVDFRKDLDLLNYIEQEFAEDLGILFYDVVRDNVPGRSMAVGDHVQLIVGKVLSRHRLHEKIPHAYTGVLVDLTLAVVGGVIA